MSFKIKWMSRSQWVGSEIETYVEEDEFETREEAEAALKKLEEDGKFMDDVYQAAIEAQGVNGWLEVKEDN